MKKGFLACIADDFTGATDLANNLVRTGLRVIQTIGVPDKPLYEQADAIVVALKTRTVAPEDAVKQSLAALAWLRDQGGGQVYFKYCSTFDSTIKGNIGPVTDALMDALGTDFTIACPAFPENGRTVFKGHLFVGDELLHESGMRNHPLTPMVDSNLVRVMQSQTQRTVGLIDYMTVAKGAQAISNRVVELKKTGVSIAIVDAINNEDLQTLGLAFSAMPLLTAGSGVALGLMHHGQADTLGANAAASPSHLVNGYRAVVSGSCSTATNGQVAHFIANGGEAYPIDPMQLAIGVDVVDHALSWAKQRFADKTVLIYATADPAAVHAIQAKLGVEKAGEMVESALASIACGLVKMGVQQLIVAGGETSGACVQALQISHMQIGPQIAPGVPWCYAPSIVASTSGLNIALKSGNFGSIDFFTSAFSVLEHAHIK